MFAQREQCFQDITNLWPSIFCYTVSWQHFLFKLPKFSILKVTMPCLTQPKIDRNEIFKKRWRQASVYMSFMKKRTPGFWSLTNIQLVPSFVNYIFSCACLPYFLFLCHRHNAQRKVAQRRRGLFWLAIPGYILTSGKTRQEHEPASHIHSQEQRKKLTHLCLLITSPSLLSSTPGIIPEIIYIWLDLPPSINITKTIPSRHAHRPTGLGPLFVKSPF